MMKRRSHTLLRFILLTIVAFCCALLFGARAHAEETNSEQSGDGWSISADGVMTLESNQGWWNAMKHGYNLRVNTLVIGCDLTSFRVYNLPYDIPSPDFFSPADVSSYDIKGNAYYDDYIRSTDIYPSEIVVEEGNPVFRVVDGMLINAITGELVLSEMGVTDVVIPEGVKVITRDAFYERDLTSVQFPTSLERIGQYAFARCENLRSVDLPDSLTQLERGAFSMSTSLKDVSLPIGLKKIEAYTFDDCAIYQINIPENVEEVGPWAFFECNQLVQVDLPDVLRTIQEYAFSGCTRLLRINLPIGLESIGEGAFFDCSNLKYIFLPDSLKQVGNDIFSECNLSVLRIPANLTFPIYDRDTREYIVNPYTKKNKTFGLSSVETVIFSGSDYDFGYPAISHAHNVYFLGKPPEDVGQILDENSVESIFCSDEFEFEWTRSTVASWVRQRLTILPAEQLKEITDQEISATPSPTDVPRPTPRPTETPWPTPMPRPTASPAGTAKPEQQGTDPLVFAFAGILALVLAGIVIVAVKNKRPKKRAQKRK